MEILKGIPVSPGMFIGEAFLQQSEEVRIPQLYVLDELMDGETKRFERAVQEVTAELESIRVQTEEQLGSTLASILTVQTQLLKDDAHLAALAAQLVAVQASPIVSSDTNLSHIRFLQPRNAAE